MSDQKCFTVIWAIENFSIYSGNNFLALKSPSWHMATTHVDSENFQLRLRVTALKVIFHLYNASLEKDSKFCEMSLISSCGRIPLKWEVNFRFNRNDSQRMIARAGLNLSINRNDIFGEKKHLVLPSDTLTVCCTILKPRINMRVLRICSVIHRINFPWTIENLPRFASSNETSWKKDISALHISIDRNPYFCIKYKCTVTTSGFYSILDIKLSSKKDSGYDIQNESSRPNYSIWTTQFNIFKTLNNDRKLQLQFECIVAVNKDNSTTTSSSSNSVQTTTAYPSSEGIKTQTVCVCPTSESAKTNSPTVAVQDPTGTLTSDFLFLLRDTTLSDATLNTEGKSFSAHKVILAARSSVFKAMYKKEDTIEGRTGIVDIEDIDSETVQRLLVFLYGESLEELQWEDASKLYYAADKYAVLLLKQKCSNILKAGLSVSNTCDAIVLADRHSDDELMKGAVDYARCHKEVISSSDWEKLEESYPRLAAKILRQIFVTTTTEYPTSDGIKTKSVCPTSESIKTKTLPRAVQDSPGTLSSDFLSLLRDTTLSDATLNTGDKSFPVHKIILSARSSVFKAMFENEDTTEGSSGVVDIEDIDSETVQRLLVFLYGESFEDLHWDDASKLHYAAYKYVILLLKQKCSNILKSGLSVSNACVAIVLAARHSDDELMKSTVDYVRDHQEVISSSAWETLEESDSRLAAKILRQVFIKNG